MVKKSVLSSTDLIFWCLTKLLTLQGSGGAERPGAGILSLLFNQKEKGNIDSFLSWKLTSELLRILTVWD